MYERVIFPELPDGAYANAINFSRSAFCNDGTDRN